MKKVFSLFVLLCVTTLIFAQTETQTATLKHGDNITAYYGCDALINAYNNAEDGDIITLSGGGFNAPTITKTITLRGAGCISDPDLMTLPTTVIGYVQIDMETDEQTLKI